MTLPHPLGLVRFYAAPGESPDIAEAVEMDLDVVEVDHLSQVDPGDGPAIVLLSAGLAEAGGGPALNALPPHVAVVATDARGRHLVESTGRFFLAAEDLAGSDGLRRGLKAAAAHALEVARYRERSRAADDVARRLGDVARVGVLLMAEDDREMLPELVLTHARRLTGSDAGTLYVCEDDGQGGRRLRLRCAHSGALPELRGGTTAETPAPRSMAAWAAGTGETLVIDDVRAVPDEAPYRFDPGFDRERGYPTRSRLVVPMADPEARVAGVLVLDNRTADPAAAIRDAADADRRVLPFTPVDEMVIRALARLAAPALRRATIA